MRVVVFGAGEAFSWGSNDFGQLGDGSTISRATPQKLPYFSGGRRAAFQVACGSSHSFISVRDAYAPTFQCHLPLNSPPPHQCPSLGSPLANRAGLEPGSADHLRLLRNRFLLLHWIAQEVTGAQILEVPLAENSRVGLAELQALRLQTSACFGFWPMLTRSVDWSNEKSEKTNTAWPNALAGILLLPLKELVLRRYLHATTPPALFHGPDIRITRLSLARARSDNGDGPQTAPSDPRLSTFAQVVTQRLYYYHSISLRRKCKFDYCQSRPFILGNWLNKPNCVEAFFPACRVVHQS